MRRLTLVAVVLVSSCGGGANATKDQVAGANGKRVLTPKDIMDRSTAAIVRIEAGGDKVGTGFILDKNGLVATNLHVVAGEKSIQVRLHDGTQYPVTTIAGVDGDRDLALLQIKPARPLPILTLGDSNLMSAGDKVVAIGNPLGVFDYSVTDGLLSQVRPMCGRQDIAANRCKQELTVLQFSAAISPGSSGGPLFNQFGEVIGVTTAITSGQNLNLAVPTNYLKPLSAQHAVIALDEFAQRTKLASEAGDGDDVKIERRIPQLKPAVFDGCKFDDIDDLVKQIGDAIENGAPLYNEGKHEACFRIYEGTAIKYEHDAACAGVRTAFGDGLLRAGGLKSYKEKAWAMRDTFDGLINAAQRWAEQHPQGIMPPKRPKK
jgi:hypothetical protein